MGWDEAVAEAMGQPPWTSLLPLAAALFYLGSSFAWGGLVLLLAARGRWGLALPLAAALLATEALVFGLKEAVARPRPGGALFAGSDFAFPSGHAARAAAALGLAWGLGLPRAWKLAALAFALLMALARLVARAHWLSDVLASLALGALLGSLVGLAWRRDWARLRTRAERALARLRTRAGAEG